MGCECRGCKNRDWGSVINSPVLEESYTQFFSVSNAVLVTKPDQIKPGLYRVSTQGGKQTAVSISANEPLLTGVKVGGSMQKGFVLSPTTAGTIPDRRVVYLPHDRVVQMITLVGAETDVLCWEFIPGNWELDNLNVNNQF